MALENPPTAERRKFGRRMSRIHAWVISDAGKRRPCFITGYSFDGVQLEPRDREGLPAEFGLNVDGLKGIIKCSVRHETAGRAGVQFGAETAASKAAIDEFFAWIRR